MRRNVEKNFRGPHKLSSRLFLIFEEKENDPVRPIPHPRDREKPS